MPPPPLKQTWAYTLETLTPLHIGAGGDPLIKDVDFIVLSKEVVVLDPIKTFEQIYKNALAAEPPPPTPSTPSNVLAAALHRLGLAEESHEPPEERDTTAEADVLRRLAQGMTPQQAFDQKWLSAADLRPGAGLRRYGLLPPPNVGAPLPNLQPPQILPQIKDAHNQPYIPGSSLKGAIRTALAAQLFATRGQALTAQDVAGRGWANPKAADDVVEKALFGPDPNHDLLRALLVGDSAPVSAPDAGGRALALAVTGTYTITRDERLVFKPGFYMALEVLAVGSRAGGLIRLDQALFTAEAQRQLRFKQSAEWLAAFPRHCNAQARVLITAEIAFYRQYQLLEVSRFYEQLLARLDSLTDGQCLLQMSWGAGWLAKTLGPALVEQAAFPEVREQFRGTMNRRPGAVFPKVRRLTLKGSNYSLPDVPPGWVLLTLIPSE